jgi:hypothetical protein
MGFSFDFEIFWLKVEKRGIWGMKITENSILIAIFILNSIVIVT